MSAELQGYAPFEGSQTWYKVVGDMDQAHSDTGPAPLVTIHGGPGATHDYLLSMADLARGGRAVIFYDQTGTGTQPISPTAVKTSSPSIFSPAN